MRPLRITPQHLLEHGAGLRQAPATDLHRAAFQEYVADERFGLREGGESGQAGVDFLPELSLRQAIKAGQELLWVWLGTLRFGKLRQELAAVAQGCHRLPVTGIRLTQALQGLRRQCEFTAIFVHLAEENHGFGAARMVRGIAEKTFQRGTCRGRLPQPVLGPR